MKLIDKTAVVAEIERTQKILNLDDYGGRSVMAWSEGFKNFIGTLETKDVDLNEEIKSYFKGFGKFPSVGIDDCIDIAKHFYELGIRASQPTTSVYSIEEALKENGIDPDSKEADICREAIYKIYDRLQAQKGEEI